MSKNILVAMLATILVVISIVLSVMIFNGQTEEYADNTKPEKTKEAQADKETNKDESSDDKDADKETEQSTDNNSTENNSDENNSGEKDSEDKNSDEKNPEEDSDDNGSKKDEETTNPEDTKAPLVEGAVPESAAVGDEYFEGALFIGDSRIEGFSMLSGIKNAKFYADKGLNIGQMDNKEFVKIDGVKYTVYQALEKESYDKIYIKLGVNELGWVHYEKYITHYENLIDQIKKTQPDATIYVMEVIQVTKSKSQGNDVYTKANVDKINKMLVDMVAKKGVNYLQVNEVLTDAEGYLMADAANDGVHLKQEYCKKWLEYIKTHTVQ